MNSKMRDYGYPIRQKFIREGHLQVKRDRLRERLHAEGFALIGEEVEAKEKGWKIYHQKRGWKAKT